MTSIAVLVRRAGLTLPDGAAERLDDYAARLADANARVNLVARTDVRHIAEHHVLHSLVLTRRSFPDGATVVDWGTGGGLPLIPLAICFPEVAFVGVDSVEKKTLTVRAIARAMGLTNVETWHGRAEDYHEPHTHSVSRATAPLATLWSWHAPGAAEADAVEGAWPPGLVALKGGDLTAEIDDLHTNAPGFVADVEPVGLPGAYFADKHIVTVTQVRG